MKKLFLLLTLIFFSTGNANAGKILYFGDSHSVATVGPFGIRMNQLLRTLPNAEVTTRARCGSVMGWWFSGKSTTCGYFDQDATGEALPPRPAHGESWAVNAPTPKIFSLIEKIKPDLIVIELGGNYNHAYLPAVTAKKEAKLFVTTLETYKKTFQLNVKCVWIGMPSRRLSANPAEAKKQQDTIDSIILAIQESVKDSCLFIDSTKLTTFPSVGGRDGVHYSFKQGIPVANAWAEKSFELVKEYYEKN